MSGRRAQGREELTARIVELCHRGPGRASAEAQRRRTAKPGAGRRCVSRPWL